MSSLHRVAELRQSPGWLCGQPGPCQCGRSTGAAGEGGGGGYVPQICTALAAQGGAGPINSVAPGFPPAWKWCKNAHSVATGRAHSAAPAGTQPHPCYAQRELLPYIVRDLLRTVYS